MTAFATTTPAAYQNQIGYYLIGQIQTPVYAGSVIANGAWYLSLYADMQDGATQQTVNPEAPIDRDPTVSATLTGSYWSLGSSGPYSEIDCEIVYSGWPIIVPTHGPGGSGTVVTLYVSPGASVASVVGDGGTWTVSVSLDSGSTWASIGTDTIISNVSPGVVSWAVPSGTSLDQMQVKIGVTPATSGSALTAGLVNQLQIEVLAVVVVNMAI